MRIVISCSFTILKLCHNIYMLSIFSCLMKALLQLLKQTELLTICTIIKKLRPLERCPFSTYIDGASPKVIAHLVIFTLRSVHLGSAVAKSGRIKCDFTFHFRVQKKRQMYWGYSLFRYLHNDFIWSVTTACHIYDTEYWQTWSFLMNNSLYEITCNVILLTMLVTQSSNLLQKNCPLSPYTIE